MINKTIYILTFFLLIGCGSKDNTSLFNQATDLENQGNFKEAIDVLSKALKLDPNDIECYNNRAWDYYDLKDFKNSSSDFNQILKIDSLNTAALYGLGYISYEKENYDNAIEYFDKVINIKGTGLTQKLVDNVGLGIRAPLEANMSQVLHYKKLSEEKLR